MLFRSGAIFRGLLFDVEQRRQNQRFINIYKEEESFNNIFSTKGLKYKNNIISYIESENPKGNKVAVLFKTLQTNKCIIDSITITEFMRVFKFHFQYDIGGESNILKYLNSNNDSHNIRQKDIDGLTKKLEIATNKPS